MSHTALGKCRTCDRKQRKSYRYFQRRKLLTLRFYCVKFTHKTTNEMFYKYGITSKTVPQRFRAELINYDIEILGEKIIPMYEAVKLEAKHLHDKCVQGRMYVPAEKISGWSECFR